MNDKVRDIERLKHILEQIDALSVASSAMSLEHLDDDKVRYYGLVKMTEIIGEAAYKLSHEFTDTHTDVPWKVIRGMRHYLVHEYYQISKEGLWETITIDLPSIRPFVVKYIEELGAD